MSSHNPSDDSPQRGDDHMHGARVGVELSGESSHRARTVAQCRGADIKYVQAVVYHAHERVSGNFDLVYTSLGVLCWPPDVGARLLLFSRRANLSWSVTIIPCS